MSIDLFASLLVLALLIGMVTSYAARLALRGPAHFARVDAAGASPLLGKGAMEMGYWGVRPLARACFRAGLSANVITGASLGLGVAAGVALALGHLGVGGALAVASSLCDVLDGLVARETGTSTRSGGVLDAAVDRYQEFFFAGGLALHYHAHEVELSLVLLALLGSFMVSYGSAKADALGVQAPRGAMRRVERAAYLCAGALLSPITQALAHRGPLPPWVADKPMLVALALVGAVSNVSAVRRLRAVACAADAPPVRAATAAPARATAVVGAAPRESGKRPSHPTNGLVPW